MNRASRQRSGPLRLLETTYLLRSPKNARRLIDAIESARAGSITEHDLTSE